MQGMSALTNDEEAGRFSRMNNALPQQRFSCKTVKGHCINLQSIFSHAKLSELQVVLDKFEKPQTVV